MIRKVCTLLLWAMAGACLNAQQTTTVTIAEPGSGSLESYAKRADIVALVRVVAGDAESYETPLYKAEVITGFKGVAAGQTIFFGRYIGTRLGWEYVVYLQSAKELIAPKANSTAAFGTVHYSQVFNEGYSSMETSYECVFGDGDKGCDYGVRVCTDYVTLPLKTPVFPPLSETTPFGCRWVRKRTFLSLLGSPTAAREQSLGAQEAHICCSVEDCKGRRVTPNLELTMPVHLYGSLVDQTGAPFKLSKVSLRRWVSPTSQSALKTVVTDTAGHFDLGTVEAGQYRFLPSETGAFRQPSHLVCSQKECRLELVLQATGTDVAEAICPIL